MLLAAVLVGLPLGCAWVGGYDQVLADVAMFPPQCEDWVSDSARLWRVKCPFNWWIFAAMGVAVAAAVWPFARRFCRALGSGASSSSCKSGRETASPLLGFELEVLRLSGLAPDFSKFDKNAEWSAFSLETGAFGTGEGRCIRVSRDVAEYLANGAKNVKNAQTPLDAARVIGVFYQFHLDCASDVRRTVLGMISSSKEGNG